MSQPGSVTQSGYEYVGEELDLFALAVNWKRYFRSQLADVIRGDVLEVGAGIGETTRHLCDGRQRSWLCLEPDAQLAARLESSIARGGLSPTPRVQIGTLADVDSEARFDAILYIDVLEHIEHDAEELRRAAALLGRGGCIVVLSPAFGFLYSEFDRAVGHFRRYTRRTLAAAFPASLRRRQLRYLDGVGFLASLANRMLLHQSIPSRQQIELWDRRMIPVSRLVDGLFQRWFGRSVLAVYQRA
jgi:2-polyprenyl-3-methyl-5-hydroxy-6-metoxy-1,4-benzoquinol methylase